MGRNFQCLNMVACVHPQKDKWKLKLWRQHMYKHLGHSFNKDKFKQPFFRDYFDIGMAIIECFLLPSLILLISKVSNFFNFLIIILFFLSKVSLLLSNKAKQSYYFICWLFWGKTHTRSCSGLTPNYLHLRINPVTLAFGLF